MAVGDHQPHPGEAALCKGGEELAPAALGLAVAQLGTEPLTVPVSVYVVYVHRHDKGPAAVQIEGNVALSDSWRYRLRNASTCPSICRQVRLT